jgi:hypothetical protein
MILRTFSSLAIALAVSCGASEGATAQTPSSRSPSQAVIGNQSEAGSPGHPQEPDGIGPFHRALKQRTQSDEASPGKPQSSSKTSQ